MVLLMALRRMAPVTVFGLLGIAAYPLARLSPVIALRNLRAFAWLAVVTLMVHGLFTEGVPLWRIPGLSAGLTREGLQRGIFYTLRLAAMVVIANALTLTTSPMELTDGMERLLRPFRRVGVPAHDIAMTLSIAIRFIPIFIDEADRIQKAQISRGGRVSGSPVRRVRGVFPLVIPLFVSSLRKANDLALAMEARGYSGGDGRTSLMELRFRRRDAMAGVVTAAVFAALVWTDRLAAGA